VESAAIQETISDKISQITSVLNATTTPTLSASVPAFVPSEQPPRPELPVVTNHVSRLPKLHLPTFSGDPLT